MALTRAKTTDTPVNETVADQTNQVNQEELDLAKQAADEEAKLAADKKAEQEKADAKAKEDADKAALDDEQEPSTVTEQQVKEATIEKSEIKPEQVETRAVAVKEEGAVAPGAAPGAVGGAMAAFTKEMEAEGFEGLQLTGMSFDRVKLHEAQFLLGSEDVKLGDEIFVNVMSTRKIFVVRQHSGQKAEMFYSYHEQGLYKTDGTSAQDILDEWKEEGYGTPEAPLEIKTYLEGMAQLVNRDDEYEGHMVSLSIPPASRDRFAGAVAVGRQRFGAKSPAELVIKCKVGAKVGTGDEAFRPWVFTAHSLMAL